MDLRMMIMMIRDNFAYFSIKHVLEIIIWEYGFRPLK